MQTLRVLVVDDEPGMRRGAARVLASTQMRLPDIEGEVAFEVEEAADAESGLALFESRPPDLLLLDHKLPGMQGLELLERVAGAGSDTLVVMVTAYATIETAVTATKRGAFDFLAKPFTPEELRGTVQKAARHLLLQREARRLAKERREVRFQFVSVLAHELKAPLAGVEGYLRLLKERVVSAEDGGRYDEVLDRSLARVDGMRKLILDLLDLTRLESGQMARRVEPVDLRAAAERALETARPAAAALGLRLSLEVPGEALFPAVPSEVEILLNNLVSNAVKYNRPGGSVTVRADVSGGRARLEVADSGIGMTEPERSRLFGEFVRIKNEQTAGIPGTGLGLSIVKKVVELYGGSIEVQGALGEGTRFTVTLADR